MRLPVKEKFMKFGDFAWTGSGPRGDVSVGVEYKKLDELIGRITDKTLVTHQLPGMLKRYQYSYLLIEATIQPNKHSGLEKFKPFKSRNNKSLGMFLPTRAAITYPMLQRYLFSLEHACVETHPERRIRVRFSSGLADTVGFLSALYGWWQKPWSSHKSAFTLPAREDNHPTNVGFILGTPTVFRRMVSCLPGIGWARSAAVAKYFKARTLDGRLRKLRRAGIKEWAEITTTDRNGRSRRIGLKLAKRIHQELYGR